MYLSSRGTTPLSTSASISHKGPPPASKTSPGQTDMGGMCPAKSCRPHRRRHSPGHPAPCVRITNATSGPVQFWTPPQGTAWQSSGPISGHYRLAVQSALPRLPQIEGTPDACPRLAGSRTCGRYEDERNFAFVSVWPMPTPCLLPVELSTHITI